MEAHRNPIEELLQKRTDELALANRKLKQKIEEALGRKVDLVEYDTLKPFLRERILKEQVVLL